MDKAELKAVRFEDGWKEKIYGMAEEGKREMVCERTGKERQEGLK